VTIGLGLAARLFLVLLLVVVPSFALIDSPDLPIPGISDGSDGTVCDDVARKDLTPLGTTVTPEMEVRPDVVSAPHRLVWRAIPPDPAHRPPSSRSPPAR
jgi:hypothetical protein